MEHPPAVDVNRSFFVHYVLEEQSRRGRTLCVLDFGCGDGQLVRLLRDAGVDAYGADVFYDGASYEAVFSSPLYREGRLMRIEGDVLPFPSGRFDLVVSDQVFEHIEDFGPALDEIDRVLGPGGFSYHHFPSAEVLREGHIGIPLAHKLPRGGLRYRYVLALRSLGLGKFKTAELTPAQWTAARLRWIDEYCFYKPYSEVRRALTEDFVIHHEEFRYCLHRAGERRWLRMLLSSAALQPIACRIFRRLAFMALRVDPRDERRASPPEKCG